MRASRGDGIVPALRPGVGFYIVGVDVFEELQHSDIDVILVKLTSWCFYRVFGKRKCWRDTEENEPALSSLKNDLAGGANRSS